jgi:hypothetical protein
MNKVSDILNVILGIISLAIGVYFFIDTSLPYIKIFDLNTIVQGFKNLSLILIQSIIYMNYCLTY